MNEAGLIDDCFLHDKDRLRHDEALKLLQERLSPIAGTEAVSIGAALGRVAAKDIVAPHNVPLHTNSAVDGYAFAHSDLGPKPFPVSLRIAAGDLSPLALKAGTAARIFMFPPRIGFFSILSPVSAAFATAIACGPRAMARTYSPTPPRAPAVARRSSTGGR